MTVAPVQLDSLSVPGVVGVISATMTEIDPPDEGDVIVNMGRMTNEDHLLMVRTSPTHSLVQKHFTAARGHVSGEASILFRIEPESITMGAPKQTSDIDASSTRVGQQCGNRCSVFGYTFIRVAAPIGEADFVARPEARNDFRQSVEIRNPINEVLDVISFGPSC